MTFPANIREPVLQRLQVLCPLNEFHPLKIVNALPDNYLIDSSAGVSSDFDNVCGWITTNSA